jgi:DNA-binding transcriptional MerR regulator
MESAKLLTSDVARRLGVTPDYVRILERTKQLHATKTEGGIRLFDLVDVERFQRQRAMKSEQRSTRR